MELCESDTSEFCTLLKKLKLTNHQTKIMNKENNLNQIIENLILLVTSKNLPDDYQLITQTVLAAVQNKDSLITDIKAIKRSDNQNFVSIIKSKIDANIEYTHIVELIGNALNLIMNTLLYSDGDKIGDLINTIRNSILVLIGDFRKSQDYIQTSATYSILNPEQDFWFYVRIPMVYIRSIQIIIILKIRSRMLLNPYIRMLKYITILTQVYRPNV